MEQPPLIDIESADGENSRMAGCVGCFAKLLPMGVGLLFLLFVLMVAAWFIWGDDLRSGEEVAGGTISEVVEEKKGVAGFLDKVKRAVKGGSQENDLVSSEGGEVAGAGTAAGAVGKSTALSEAVGVEAKSPEERNKMLEEKFGHLAEENATGVNNQVAPTDAAGSSSSAKLPDGIVVQTTRRGGSFGSATGTATKGEGERQYMIWRHDFSTSGSDLEFEIIFQEAGGQLHFRCFVLPYDAQTARLFRGDKGDLNLSFTTGSGEKLLPEDGVFSLPLTKMTAFEANGQVAGWVARGQLPLNTQKYTDLKSVRLGWDFDEELGDWLKELSDIRN